MFLPLFKGSVPPQPHQHIYFSFIVKFIANEGFCDWNDILLPLKKKSLVSRKLKWGQWKWSRGARLAGPSSWFCPVVLLVLLFPPIPGGSDGKESGCNAGDLGLIPGLEGAPGEGNGYPLQYSCRGNPKGRGAWWATVHAVTELDRTVWLTLSLCFVSCPWLSQ